MFNKRHIVRTIAATVSILALSFTAACGSGQSTASNSADSDDITQQTYKPGKLTIATGQPAYEPWVMNDKPESGEGYEAAVAYAVADKLGFKKSDVVWTRTAFDTAIAPGAKDWDFNIQQFGITDERKKAVDFSSSYYNDSQSVGQERQQVRQRHQGIRSEGCDRGRHGRHPCLRLRQGEHQGRHPDVQ